MSRYYYLISTLPLLSLDAERHPDRNEFLDLCARELTPGDRALLLQARLDPAAIQAEPEAAAGPAADVAGGLDADPRLGDGSPEASAWLTLRRWINWERCLRDELVRLRAQALGVEGSRYLRPASYIAGAVEAARSAASAENPLAAEAVLDRARWAQLDELEVGHQFDLAQLIIYALRLELLDRRAQMTSDRGRSSFESWYEGAVHDRR